MRWRTALAGSSVFFAVAPGTVAGIVPWLLTRWRLGAPLSHWLPVRVLGVALTVAGAVVLLHAFGRFVREGAGTPAPVAPTDRLVIGGAYRYVRNPMYVAVVATIVGQALLLWRPVLLAYAVLVWVACAAFVRWYEEPTLRRRYGEQYESYRANVPAWLPRRPRRPASAEPTSPRNHG
jgi:protein-S-isoprenylcysteine O-methyltransferase Ste14